MFITVASFLDPLEARIVHGRLSAEGIEAYLADEHQAINDWYMRQALGGVKLRVRHDQADEARALVAQLSKGALALQAEGDNEPAGTQADSWSQRAAFLGLFAFGLPLPWRRRRSRTP